MIKVSVIVPVYKVSLEYLRECFNSLLAQTMQDCEFIIVSDGAPDAECSICEEYAIKNQRFKFFRREHAGVSSTRNFGIKQAQGEYITFVDSDDWIDPDYLDKTYLYANATKSDILLCECCLAYKDRQEKHPFATQSIPCLSFEQKDFVIRNIISTQDFNAIACAGICSKLYKRNVCGDILFQDLGFAEDRIFNYSLFTKCSKICYLHNAFYFYRFNSSSTSHTFSISFWDECHEYLQLMRAKIKPIQKGILGREAIQLFYKSWSLCYMNKNNPNSFSHRMNSLSTNIKQLNKEGFLKEISLKNLSILVRIEVFLFQHNCIFPIWLHGFITSLKNATCKL